MQDYDDLMRQILAEKRGSIEGIEAQLEERGKMNNSTLDRINLAPGAAFVDSIVPGSKLSQAFGGPSPFEKNEAVKMKLRQALDNQKDEYGAQALAFFKNKTDMDQNALENQRANADRDFNRWMQNENLKLNKDKLGMMGENQRAKLAAAQKKELEKKNEVPKFTADQTNAATFGRRMQQAEAVFGDLGDKGYNRASRGESLSEYFLPTEWQGEDLRKQSQAERNFINAALRRESGAAIAPSEFSSAEAQYFPRPGDTPDILAQKRANRLQAISGLKLGAGQAWDHLKLIDPMGNEVKSAADQNQNMVRVRKGNEILQVPREDITEALKEGYEVMD
jgi:hypothetical protein